MVDGLVSETAKVTPAGHEAGGEGSFVVRMARPGGSGEVETLEFDLGLFKRNSEKLRVCNPAASRALAKRPNARSADDVEEITQHCRRACPAFQSYSLEQQRQMSLSCVYDRFFQHRVILREGLRPDGFYFVLNGTLIESSSTVPSAREIQAGQKFGEDDLKHGRLRQTTIVTKSKEGVELLYICKQDYVKIFDMTSRFDNEYIRRICKKDFIMEKYPLQKILNNSLTHSLLKFKYNRLICADSNTTEYIYVIISGEAKAILRMNAEGSAIAAKWQYGHSRRAGATRSAPIITTQRAVRSAWSRDPAQSSSNRPSTTPGNAFASCQSDVPVTTDTRRTSEAHLSCLDESSTVDKRKQHSTTGGSKSIGRVSICFDDGSSQISPFSVPSPRTPKGAAEASGERYRRFPFCDRDHSAAEALFVQVERLLAGQVFGLRACLPHEERGSSAALVSAGCEVVQIQRKFFERYLDDNLLNIIRLKAEPFPVLQELVQRLKARQKWKAYTSGLAFDAAKVKVQLSRTAF